MLDQIYKINADLDRLVLHQIFLNSIKPSRQTRTIKSYIRVREHAIKLHEVFREKFDADHLYACSTDHNVCLLLRGVSADKKSRSSGTVRFNMLFAFDSWHEIVFESVGGQEEIQHDKTTDRSGTDNCDGISVVDEQRSSFAALISLFVRKPLSDPNLGAIGQALRDTTAGAFFVLFYSYCMHSD